MRNVIPIHERMSLSVEVAAMLLSISRAKAYRMIATGELPSVLIGNVRRVPREAVEEMTARERWQKGA